MQTVVPHDDLENDGVPEVDGRSGRRLVILAAVYLVLGLVHAGWFMTSTLAELSGSLDEARSRLDQAGNSSVWTAADLESAEAAIPGLEADLRQAQAERDAARAAWETAQQTGEGAAEKATYDGRLARALEKRQGLDDARDRVSEIRAALQPLATARSDVDAAERGVRRGWGRMVGFGLAAAVLLWFMLVQSRRVVTRQQLVSAVTAMIITIGVLMLASRLLLEQAVPNLTAWGIVDLLLLHIVASLVMLWTVKESVLPFGMLLVVWAVTFLVPDSSEWTVLDRLVGVIISPMVLVPGAALAAWMWKRCQEDAERLRLGEQVRSMGGELSRARIVHDAMFPSPLDTGHVSFNYEYRPTQEIGGDYVHLHVSRSSGCIYVTLLDVAGHGLTAALTVNRLFGELERIRAEDPNAEPSIVMQLLNRYINLTMAHHNLYATGTCIMLDPATGNLRWVNAGHPPALLRKANGTVTDLPGTTMLLGALTWDEFESNQQEMTIDPGDVVLAYTDGAFEARNSAGKQFGIESIRQTARFSPPPRDWTKFIANAVAKYHGGHADDDILIAALCLRSLWIRAAEEQQEALAARAVVEQSMP